MSFRTGFVLSTQRSGTKLFGDILNSSKFFNPLGEVFHEDYLRFPGQAHGRPALAENDPNLRFWDFKKEQAKKEGHVYCRTYDDCCEIFRDYLLFLQSFVDEGVITTVDVMYNNLSVLSHNWQKITEPPFLLQILKKFDVPVIHLIRENLLDSYCSMKRMHKTGIRHTVTEVNAGELQITLDLKDLERTLFDNLLVRKLLKNYLKDYPLSCEIYYPDFLTDDTTIEDSSLKRLAALFNLDEKSLTFKGSPLKKTSPKKEEYVTNITEAEDLYKRLQAEVAQITLWR